MKRLSLVGVALLVSSALGPNGAARAADQIYAEGRRKRKRNQSYAPRRRLPVVFCCGYCSRGRCGRDKLSGRICLSSVLNQKFATLRCLGLSIVAAEPFDGRKDVVGGLGPFEWLGIGVVMTDEVHNVGAQCLDAAIDAAPDLFVGDERKEALNLIEPGRTGRREMDVPARPFCEPVADQRSLVGGVVVHDEMDIETARDGGLDLVEELAELCGPVTGIALADDLARRNVERREELCRAVTRVVVAAPCGLTGAHGQHGLAAVERLDLGLLVHTQDDSMLGRGDVEADHIAHLGHEVWVGRELERLHPMRLQTEGSPDALHA